MCVCIFLAYENEVIHAYGHIHGEGEGQGEGGREEKGIPTRNAKSHSVQCKITELKTSGESGLRGESVTQS